MNARNRLESAQYRKDNSDKFVSLGNGKFGGFRRGIMNGPDASTARGKRRAAKRSENKN